MSGNPLMASTSPPVGSGGAAREQAVDEVVNSAVQGNAGSGDHANASTQDAQARTGGVHPSATHVTVNTRNYADIGRGQARQMASDDAHNPGHIQASNPARVRAALRGAS